MAEEESHGKEASEGVSDLTGAEILAYYEKLGPLFTETELDAMDEVQRLDAPPDDPWEQK